MRYVVVYHDDEYGHILLVETGGGEKVYKIDNHTLGIGENKIIMDVPYPGPDFDIDSIDLVENFPNNGNLFIGNIKEEK